jgi:hypothetical protein
MKHTNLWRVRSVHTAWGLALLVALWGPATPAAVTKVTLAPVVKTYYGDCPAKIVFKGAITVNAPGVVSYIFTRSDGATDTITKKLKFTAPGTKAISTTWTLGGPALPSFNGWQAAKILGPKPIESAHANFAVYCDPPLNSAKAAHGNTDWHIDTANEFLFGQDMGGNNTAANFAPAGWTKTHIHVGLNNTAHLYDDKTRIAGGDDADLASGIDKPMLFFYAGHGWAEGWSTLGDGGRQADMLLANPDNGGSCATTGNARVRCLPTGRSCAAVVAVTIRHPKTSTARTTRRPCAMSSSAGVRYLATICGWPVVCRPWRTVTKGT